MNEEAIKYQNELSANRFLEKVVIVITIIAVVVLLFTNKYYQDPAIWLIRCIMTVAMPVVTSVALFIYYKLPEKYYYAKKYILSVPFITVIGLACMLFHGSMMMYSILAIALYARYYDRRLMIRMSIVLSVVVIACSYVALGTGMLLDLNFVTYMKGGIIHMPEDSVWIYDSADILNIPKINIIRDYTVYMTIPFLAAYAVTLGIFYGISKAEMKLFKKQIKLGQMEYEIAAASNIQSSMLSKNFEGYGAQDRASVFATMSAAKIVGGDFYDFFKLDDNHVCIMIGDVSGKGMPASLFMVRAQTCLRDMAHLGLKPSEIMERANNALNENNQNRLFVTVWLGILNLETGELDFANAGHNPPLIYRKDTGFSYLECKPNIIMAMLPNRTYLQEQIVLNPDDMILLYTDGVTEACNEDKIQYGEERLVGYLNQQKVVDAKDTIENICKELKNFQGEAEQFDDITMLALRYIR